VFFEILQYEIQKAQRPASEVVLSDGDVMKILKISKRTLATLKAERRIAFSQERKGAPARFLLSDVLDFVNRDRIESIDNERRI
jgi:hypothetical protein